MSTDATEWADADPYLWLEDVLGEPALAWVRERNRRTQQTLEIDPEFGPLNADLLAIFDSDQRIPSVSKRGEFYYNFWRDRANPRGLWRRTTLEQYRRAEPEWELVLDLDAVAAEEQENWVWGGPDVLRPDYRRCLLKLSRGGGDATVLREFDLVEKRFVADGFTLPEAKSDVGWIDFDHLFVATDFGPGSLTDSGYPRIVKRWTRGTPLEEAVTIFEGQAEDVSVFAFHDHTPGFARDFVMRLITFYSTELFLIGDGGLVKIDVPDSASKSVHRDYLVIELREPWTESATTYPAGALLVANFPAFLAGRREFTVVFEPTPTMALSAHGFLRGYLFLNVLEDVKNRISIIQLGDPDWTKTPLPGAPATGTVDIGAVDEDESNAYWMTVTDYLTPTTLLRGEIGAATEKLKALPAFFPAEGLAVEQHFATSADGTRVPYFQVARADLPLSGANPTLLYGYGGFEVSLQPAYSAAAGRAWISQGGVFVVANIRGGGEYGPRWHQAALKANRLRAYEDFAAVARDLAERKVTSPARLGIMGGSNGGLLVGNMVTLYPELFHAAVCEVPLLDMQRYHGLLAGASWMAEYGNPDEPEEWKFLRTFSPYHNVRAEGKYPHVLFLTSTRDDRVHPGHARKMMARMEEMGHPVSYYENIEGGHGGAANNAQAAYMKALAYTFLRQELFADGGEAPVG